MENKYRYTFVYIPSDETRLHGILDPLSRSSRATLLKCFGMYDTAEALLDIRETVRRSDLEDMMGSFSSMGVKTPDYYTDLYNCAWDGWYGFINVDGIGKCIVIFHNGNDADWTVTPDTEVYIGDNMSKYWD